MIAQIYVKTNVGYTSMLVSNDKGNIYFQDVLDVQEITAIQRCASFVKHELDYDSTEIYPDTLGKEILEDSYIKYCQINATIGENPCEKSKKQCINNLSTYLRLNFGVRKER